MTMDCDVSNGHHRVAEMRAKRAPACDPRVFLPTPEVVLLVDTRSRIIRCSDKFAGERLGQFEFRESLTAHEVMHPGCDRNDCKFLLDWRRAWIAHRSGLPVEWFSMGRNADMSLKLRLQPVDYACGVLFGDALSDYDDCSVLFVQDLGASRCNASSERGTEGIEIRRASLYPLRRASDPDPSLVAALDDRLRTLTGRLLLSREAERKRIAAELHDGLGQSLSLLRFEIEGSLERAKPHSIPHELEALKRSANHIRRAIDELRCITRHLRPTVIDDMGLSGSLEELCSDFELVRPNIGITCDVSGDPRHIPDELAVTIYRIAQEALNNVAQHSGANSVSMRVQADNSGVSLEVIDDGVGIPDGKPARRGLGLVTIRERTETLGGTYKLDCCEGEGCKILVTWPAGALASLR
jgi:signal transduction histidine kinase